MRNTIIAAIIGGLVAKLVPVLFMCVVIYLWVGCKVIRCTYAGLDAGLIDKMFVMFFWPAVVIVTILDERNHISKILPFGIRSPFYSKGENNSGQITHYVIYDYLQTRNHFSKKFVESFTTHTDAMVFMEEISGFTQYSSIKVAVDV